MARHKILVTLDGSDFSRQILTYVREFFGAADNELVLLRVGSRPAVNTSLPPHPVGPEMGLSAMGFEGETALASPTDVGQALESVQAVMLDELQADAMSLQQAGYTVSTFARFGDPSHEIVAFVQSENINLVAMTTHGRSGLGRLLAGSVAESVVRHVSVPVLLLHPREHTAHPGD